MSGDQVHLHLGEASKKKMKFAFLIAALGIILIGLFMHVYAVPQLKSFLAPHPWSLYPPPSEYEAMDVYLNQTCETRAIYRYVGVLEAKKFEARIDSFSEELKLLTLNNETIVAPHSWQVAYQKIEGRPIVWDFWIIAPNQSGNYEINLRFIVSNGMLSLREYPQRVAVRVEPMPYKPAPEELLTITMDKEIYQQGDIMNITIKNISNETQWFANAAYDVCFDRFNGEYWEFYDSVPGAEVITRLKPGETGQVTWKLGGHTDRPFPAGEYRVWIHGVYVEFEVV